MSRINTLLQRIKNAHPHVNLNCFYTGGGLDYVGLKLRNAESSLDLIIASSPYDDKIPTSLSEQCCIVTFAGDEWTEPKSVRWFDSVHDAVKYLSTTNQPTEHTK